MLLYQGPLPVGLWEVLEATLHGGLALQGDFTRALAPEVALAASLGYISVIDITGLTYRPKWHITNAGLSALENRGDYDDHFQ
jgi:hypothetical protein